MESVELHWRDIYLSYWIRNHPRCIEPAFNLFILACDLRSICGKLPLVIPCYNPVEMIKNSWKDQKVQPDDSYFSTSYVTKESTRKPKLIFMIYSWFHFPIFIIRHHRGFILLFRLQKKTGTNHKYTLKTSKIMHIVTWMIHDESEEVLRTNCY